MPAVVGPLHVKLHESTGELLIFPRRGCLAGTKAHDGVVYANGLARLQRQVANDPVALVEEAEDRDALGHWRDACLLSRPCVRAGEPRAIGLLL
jgi:hypothetical protein